MKNHIKKIIPYIFILLALVGVFRYVNTARAETQAQCWQANGYPIPLQGIGSQSLCLRGNTGDPTRDRIWSSTAPITKFEVGGAAAPQQQAAPVAEDKTGAFQQAIDSSCNTIWSSSFSGCILKFIYYVYFQIPTFLLYVSASLFNALIALVIQSKLYDQAFITGAWSVVRDLSNIFFILILIYIAVKMILNMGGSETKSMVANVIIMAVLINFSLFFTKVIIDSSNVLALIFYNKLETTYVDSKGKDVERDTPPTITGGAKDTSGAMYAKFDATRLIDLDFIQKIKDTTNKGSATGSGDSLPFGITLGIMVVAGTIMVFAAYTFFTSGIFFLGRLIELWVLMIFSPFAFMSFTVPQLAHTEYIGWSSWFGKLIATSFMAPIFMFFLYSIFKIMEGPTFLSGFIDPKNTHWMPTLLGITLPALIILGMLKKAAEFAKKGGGQFGEMAMSALKLAGGAALGLAGGVVAAGAVGTIGKAARAVANDDDLRAKAASGDKDAQRKLKLANSFANKSFDFRDTGFGKFVAGKSGMDFNKGMKTLGLDTHAFEKGSFGQAEHAKKHGEEVLKTYALTSAEANKRDDQNKRAKEYQKDLIEARNWATKFGTPFDEAEFKKDYVAGGDMTAHGLTKTVEKGSVEKVITSQQINSERKKSFIEDEKKEHHKAQNATVYQSMAGIVKDIAKQSATPMGLATIVGGLATGGIVGGVYLAGGVAAVSVMKVLKSKLEVHVSDDQVANDLLRGKSKAEKLAEAAKDVAKEEDKEAKGDEHAETDHKENTSHAHDSHDSHTPNK